MEGRICACGKSADDAAPLLDIRNLCVSFRKRGEALYAVRNLNLAMPASRITCLVGESGCGKSLTCRAINGLAPEGAVTEGQILFNGEDLLAMPEKAMLKIRGARIGMIFQEPMTSLNPVMTVGSQTAEPLRAHMGMSRRKAHAKVVDLFAQVGIPSPEDRYDDYPHQLSGGMRQRVMIAMALACSPQLLLADEPTTALDATIQGQILRLILEQSRQRGMAVLLITHDLGVVAKVADYVGVMYAGILAEYAAADDLFKNPMHPYTKGLIASSPGASSFGCRRLPAIPGAVPSLEQMPKGCPFQPRCQSALPRCAKEMPPVADMAGRRTACWLYARQGSQ